MGKSQKLYEKAKKIIPGGTQLLSKRPEMFLPGLWPSYYSKAKGCEVWDLDGNHYYDMGIMGIGTSVLGYANPTINKAVKKGIDNGNMCTLNAPEEVELAEKLIEIHPWAGMARFAKSGGESNTIAIRIARAFSGKDKIAFCGYHGWHDWYLSSNLNDASNLDNQLLPGLSTKGVAKNLKNTSLPFEYGNIEQFKKIVENTKDELGIVIMEVQRYKPADLDFLREIRKITSKIGAVLIFDEISSAFRFNTGGQHLLYDIVPDIAVFGKALGNGFPIGAVIGKKEIMQAAQETFISSSYWTERSGYVAAVETIKFFEKNNVAEYTMKMGNYIGKELNEIFKKYDLDIEMLMGMPSAISMLIKEKDSAILKTVFIQEMLKRGYLASTTIYVSYAHKKKVVDKYLNDAKEVFKYISNNRNNLKDLLDDEVSHSGFQRLN
ncbi:Glutamate-1-semialdehyde 2,1-aminomutase [Sulfurimonas gotlandica GD1]|uniref:Glutamate-1-semialdehyde 2,1-aminomutase n=2 Tax=Sulfurimonas TaxID=202746 RepID=B6BKJ3_SULGG|nr:glutamate-1-semialdehyde 2,1-aminomutase [Sulfurimonas gotlandica GD1]EHP29048.1 Glutamate-1-semialdehyde 2,1-aminomutase [Sulfurimonas gotlandica GD1]